MSDSKLDQALGDLPRDVEPNHDLWPGIRAGIELAPATVQRKSTRILMQLAAGFVLLIASSATTYLLTRQSLEHSSAANFATGSVNGDAVIAEYLRSRAELDRLFVQRIAALPATTRSKLESNLADLRRAENEIVASLTKNPSDELLRELLLSTYQSEAQLLASVNEIPVTDLQRSQS